MALTPFPQQAMVLAAGRGTRLLPLTSKIPKPLIPLQGRPVLEYIFNHLHKDQIQQCIVNTHHLASHIEEYLAICPYAKELDITTSFEPILLETGGGITKALPFFQGCPFFSINGDIWWQNKEKSALLRLKEAWDCENMDCLLLLIEPHFALGYTGKGDFFLAQSGQLTHRGSQSKAPFIYGGLQILHPRLFEGRSPVPFSIVELFQTAEKKGRLYGVVHKGWWGDMGSFQSLDLINEFLANNQTAL